MVAMAKKPKKSAPVPPCSHVPGDLRFLMDGLTRYFRCPSCFSAFWLDGPSILGPKDTAAKLAASDRLFEITPEEAEWAKGL